jgi:hypothetical protein
VTSFPHESHDAAWRHDAVPAGERCRAWDLDRPRQLAAARRGVRQYLAGCGRPASADAAHLVVMVLDELGSNALRHGTQPASVELCEHGDGWLVIARDADRERTPEPAVDRPAEEGGMGLHMVAALTPRHGVAVDEGCKCVWAIVPCR